MDLQALIAQYQANGGSVTKLPKGARTMTSRQIKEACGYTHETQVIFLVSLLGEDGVEWTERVTANSARSAEDYCRRQWPESRFLGCRPHYR